MSSELGRSGGQSGRPERSQRPIGGKRRVEVSQRDRLYTRGLAQRINIFGKQLPDETRLEDLFSGSTPASFPVHGKARKDALKAYTTIVRASLRSGFETVEDIRIASVQELIQAGKEAGKVNRRGNQMSEIKAGFIKTVFERKPDNPSRG